MGSALTEDLGSIITLLIALGGIIGTWYRLKARVEAGELFHVELRKDTEKDVERLRSLIEVDLTAFKARVLEDRLAAVLMDSKQQLAIKEFKSDILAVVKESNDRLLRELDWLKNKLTNHRHSSDEK